MVTLPLLRHYLTLAAFRLPSYFHLLHDEAQLVKQRRALRERNPPRNSQLETHRTDERPDSPSGAAPVFSPS